MLGQAEKTSQEETSLGLFKTIFFITDALENEPECLSPNLVYNQQIRPKEQILDYAEKTCQEETLQLISEEHKITTNFV